MEKCYLNKIRNRLKHSNILVQEEQDLKKMLRFFFINLAIKRDYDCPGIRTEEAMDD